MRKRQQKTCATNNGQTKNYFTIQDDVGTLMDDAIHATEYWQERNAGILRNDPFVLYSFKSKQDARKALLELPCIKATSKHGRLICTEALYYGYYQRPDKKYSAIICGKDLTHELWEQATVSFHKYNGIPIGPGNLEPQKQSTANNETNSSLADEVVFVEETYTEQDAIIMTYRVHDGPSAAAAKAFLTNNPVSQLFHYHVIRTPEGNYCQDIEGIYKE